MTILLPIPVKAGDRINLSAPTVSGSASIACVVQGVFPNLREFYANSVQPSNVEASRASEQMASALGATGAVFGQADMPDAPFFRMGVLWWPDGKWTDMIGTPLTVEFKAVD